ncbi:MAG: right-handed parallel beta-helix repeat-containing protein [Thermoplasmata archaeon]|nr:right-handed parallel beta-helix repeat-containing protein [Thermoplasmata archaeon]
MKKASLFVAFIVFASLLFVTLTILPGDVRAATRYVGGGGPGNYTTIQEAIDVADPGDTIYVYNGTYYENVIVNKTLTLVGEDKNITIVDGGWGDDAMYISSDWVNVSGFTVTHSGVNWFDAGIDLDSVENCRIADNIARENARGFLLYYSHKNTLSGNIAIDDWDYGFFLDLSNNNTITGNNISNSDSGIYLVESNDNTVSENIAWDNGNGIRISGSRNITVELNRLFLSWDRGIYLYSSSEITVRGNNASGNFQGVYAWSLSDSRILNNTIAGNEDHGIRVGSSSNVTLADNNVSRNKMGMDLGYITLAAIKGNTVSSNRWNGIHLQSSSDVTVISNNISNNDWGIWAEGNLNVTFTANTFHSDGIFLTGNILSNFNSHTITGDNLVDNLPIYYHKDGNDVVVDDIPVGQLIIVNCTNVAIANLTVENTDVGIEMAFVDGAVVSYSNFSSNEQRGVYLYVSSGISVTNSNFSFNKNGVRVIMSKTTIKNNNFTDNSFGMYVTSTNVSIIGNNIVSNSGGIRVLNSTDLTIAGNNISSNTNFGILLVGSNMTRVYHNNMMNNTVQAIDGMGSENSWDDGYPSGGNYWSDYSGEDNCSGPNQDNCPDPDGIGDTPYVIDADSQDRYPLMLPVEKAFPRAPSDLQTTLSGSALENITLTWSLSPDDGAGNQLVTGYAIWRGTIHNPGGSGYELIASLPNGTSEFTDVMVGEGNPNSYYYRVCAVDSRNNTACAENQAGKFTRSLPQGPNLISIPFIQPNESIEYVLQTVDYDKAWYYDSSSQEWKWFMKSKGYRRGLWNVNHTMGLWVNVTGDWNLIVAGIVPAQTMIHLRSGWNLVGFPSFNTTYTVADLKAETGATRVEGLETMPPFPPHFLRLLGDADMLLAGEAYWVKVDADTIWTVEVA